MTNRARWLLQIVLGVLFFAATFSMLAPAAVPARAGPVNIAGCPMFPPDNIWNARVARAMLFHATARSLGRLAPFHSFEAAAFAWGRLRAAFPDALAAMLMPNHLHQLVASSDADALRRRLAAVLSGLTRSGLCGPEHLIWEPVPEPKLVEPTSLPHPQRVILRLRPVQPLDRQRRTASRFGTISWILPLAAAGVKKLRNVAPSKHAFFAYAIRNSHVGVGAGSEGLIAGVFRIPANCRAAEDTPAIATPSMNMEAEHIASTIKKMARAT